MNDTLWNAFVWGITVSLFSLNLIRLPMKNAKDSKPYFFHSLVNKCWWKFAITLFMFKMTVEKYCVNLHYLGCFYQKCHFESKPITINTFASLWIVLMCQVYFECFSEFSMRKATLTTKSHFSLLSDLKAGLRQQDEMTEKEVFL